MTTFLRGGPFIVALLLFVNTLPFTSEAGIREVGLPGGYPSIGAALVGATAGDVIRIAAGTYAEALEISTPVTLTSIESGTYPVITPPIGFNPSDPLVRITANAADQFRGAVLEGLEIRGNGVENIGISLNSISSRGLVLIINCRVNKFTTGIALDASSAIKLKYNEIYDCETGVRLSNLSDANAVEWNSLHHNGTGIAIDESKNNVFQRNSIRSNSEGVHVSGATSDVRLLSEWITGNTTGVFLAGFNPASTRYVNFCDLSNNLVGVQNNSTAIITAFGCWWGSANGPEDLAGVIEVPASNPITVAEMRNGEPLPLGSPVSDNVNYLGWRTSLAPDLCQNGPGSEAIQAKDIISSIYTTSDKGWKAWSKALELIYIALQSDYWMECDQLSPDGKKAFESLEDAINHLQSMLDVEPPSPDLNSATVTAIAQIVSCARGIAFTSLNGLSCDRKECQEELTKASKEFAKGDEARDKAEFEKAVDHYRKSWEHVQKAKKNSFGKPDADQIASLPGEYKLGQNFPNPFNPSTDISFTLPEDGYVLLEVYSVLGQKVGTLINEARTAGSYSVRFDGSGLASGVYLYRIRAGAFSDLKHMVLVR